MITQPIFRAAALAALALFATAGHAQGLGGMLNKAKAKVNQATSAPTRSAGPAVAQTATQAAQGNTGPIPDSPSMSALTVDNNIEFAQTVLANHRPFTAGERTVDADYFYRFNRDGYHAPIQYTWDRPYVAFITPRHYYLFSVIENFSEEMHSYYDPTETSNRYARAKMLKIKEMHFTTTPQPAPDKYAGHSGYVLSWNAATGVLTAAISVAPGNRGISNFNREDLKAFIDDNIK